MRELLEGRPITENSHYHAMLEELARNGRTASPRLYTRAEIDDYFRSLLTLIERIRSEGYQSQAEIGGPMKHEITVRIDRYGQLIKCREGTHRLAITRLLGLRWVPITVDLVHSVWFKACLERWEGDPRTAIMCELEQMGEVIRGV
ncbi:hypothetical protein CKO15_01065 [Halorhodospira abdelmalekii]|nr:hypothetical protein [Halorhodospira abdelmalekii]